MSLADYLYVETTITGPHGTRHHVMAAVLDGETWRVEYFPDLEEGETIDYRADDIADWAATMLKFRRPARSTDD